MEYHFRQLARISFGRTDALSFELIITGYHEAFEEGFYVIMKAKWLQSCCSMLSSPLTSLLYTSQLEFASL